MSGARQASLFLDMLAAERGASRNTLDAYRRDLEDYLDLPEGAGLPIRSPPAPKTVRGFIGEPRGAGPQGELRRTPALGRAAVPQVPLRGGLRACRSDGRRRGAEALPGAAEGAVGWKRSIVSSAAAHESAARPTPRRGSAFAPARMACLLELLYATGLRVSELDRAAGQRRQDARAVPGVRGKGAKVRLVPLTEAAPDSAMRLSRPPRKARHCGTLALSGGQRQRPLTRQAFARDLKLAAAAAGLRADRVIPTCSGTPSRATSSRTAPICASCRSSWAIPTSRRRRSTPTSSTSG